MYIFNITHTYIHIHTLGQIHAHDGPINQPSEPSTCAVCNKAFTISSTVIARPPDFSLVHAKCVDTHAHDDSPKAMVSIYACMCDVPPHTHMRVP